MCYLCRLSSFNARLLFIMPTDNNCACYNKMAIFFFLVTDTLEVVARVHSEWDARSLCKSIAFELNQRFPSPITSNNYGLNANQVTIPIGQKSFVWHTTADVEQLSANTDVQY